MTGNITIALEGATHQGSVALLRDAKVVAERSLGDDGTPGAGRGDRLMPAVAAAMKEIGAGRSDIARIVCGSGPGSFTSLRVAGSIAKGLATGYGVDLLAVSSLVLTVAGARKRLGPGRYVSLLDAMRGEFYVQRVDVEPDGGITRVGKAGVVSAEDLSRLHDHETDLRAIGPGQELDEAPHARGVALLLGNIIRGTPVDLALWEPDYGRLAEAQVKWEAAHGRPLGK